MIFLPNYFFKDRDNYCVLQGSLCRVDRSVQGLPDILTSAMSQLHDRNTMVCIHIPHWHQITDDDGRTLRNILKVDPVTGEPEQQSRSYDLLQYISMCLQFLDDEYALHVQQWCHKQVMCIDEPEDDF